MTGRDDPLLGKRIGGFLVESILGQGGMGTVYRAVQESLQRPVALKVIRNDVVKQAGSEEFIQRFQREARIAASFTHPNSIAVHDFGQLDDGMLYMALELAEGRELTEILEQEGPLASDRAVDLMLQILSVLSKAHRSDITHRDLKPQNVMVALEGGRELVKVLDFGIAKIKDFPGSATTFVTKAGRIIGTVQYMSPEQAQALPLDGRSDLYSAGVLLSIMG